MDMMLEGDQTLPVDINGSCRLPDSMDDGDGSPDSMTALSFPDKMTPIKALTMKDYENQIAALKKENFNLKLRIYFMEERMQQKCDDSTEDVFKTNIELKVELESMKREMSEKQELLVSASKALESLAVRDTGDCQRVGERARRDMDALQQALNKKIADLEQDLHAAEEEVEKMAAIAEKEKLRNIDLEKQLVGLGLSEAFTPVHEPNNDLQQALREKDGIIENLRISLRDKEGLINQKTNANQGAETPAHDHIKQLTILISDKDRQLQELREQLGGERDKAQRDYKVSPVWRLSEVHTGGSLT